MVGSSESGPERGSVSEYDEELRGEAETTVTVIESEERVVTYEVVPPRPRRGPDDPETSEPYADNGLVLPVPKYIRDLIRKNRKIA